jgi:hypothetical protein
MVHSDGILKKVAQGWQTNVIASFQKGTPLTFYSNSNASFQNQVPDLTRVDAVGPIPRQNPRSSNNTGFSSQCNGGNSNPGNFWIDPTNLVCAPCPFQDPSCTQPGDVGTGIPLFTYGDLPRNFLRGPGINNFDMSLVKKTQIRESKSIEFRTEFFNAFNHTQFLKVDNQGGSSTFGQVITDRGPRVIQFGLKFYF